MARRESKRARADSVLEVTLEALESEGRHDSTGQFTISAKQAAQKLGAFQLNTPESWILAVVQAANRAKASSIKVTQSSSETKVEVAGLPDWAWSDLEPHIAELGRDRTYLSGLATAARAMAGARERHEFTLCTPAGIAITWDGERWVHQEAAFLSGLSKGRTTFRYSHVSRQARQDASYLERGRLARQSMLALSRVLAKNALASNVPITCDGMRLDGVQYTGIPQGQLPRLVALIPVDLTTSPPVEFPIPAKWSSTGTHQIQLLETFRLPAAGKRPGLGPSGRCSCLSLLWIGLRSPKNSANVGLVKLQLDQPLSGLCWVQDGVVVARRPVKLDGFIGVQIFVNAAGFGTDLSGLALRETPELEEHYRELKAELPKALEAFLSCDENGIDVSAPFHPILAFVAGGLAVGAGLMTGGAATVAGLTLGAVAGKSGYSQKARLAGFDKQLDADLDNLRERLSRALAQS